MCENDHVDTADKTRTLRTRACYSSHIVSQMTYSTNTKRNALRCIMIDIFRWRRGFIYLRAWCLFQSGLSTSEGLDGMSSGCSSTYSCLIIVVGWGSVEYLIVVISRSIIVLLPSSARRLSRGEIGFGLLWICHARKRVRANQAAWNIEIDDK